MTLLRRTLTLLAPVAGLLLPMAAPTASAETAGAEPTAARADAVYLALGGFHTCALLADGDVTCWGDNSQGQLGYGNLDTIGDDETPASAGTVSLGGPAIALAAGQEFTCALMQGGTVRCWGSGDYGQLGLANYDDIGDDELPSSVGPIDIGGTAVAIAAGKYQACAILTTGELVCWGSSLGGLGYGDFSNVGDDETPASVGPVSIGGTAVAVTAGDNHTCVLLQDGTVRCWGDGAYGQTGQGSTADIGDNELPSSVPVVDVGGTVEAIASGAEHTCALLDTGSMRCWGLNDSGQLGTNTAPTSHIGDDEAPSTAALVNVGGAVKAISAGNKHTCAVLVDGSVKCWGQNFNGQLGLASLTSTDGPTQAADVGGALRAIASGYSHNCGLRVSGGLVCWGQGAFGQLGYGNTNAIGDDETPASAGTVSAGGSVGPETPDENGGGDDGNTLPDTGVGSLPVVTLLVLVGGAVVLLSSRRRRTA